jgi:4-amino-4-deoxy-L-arabinose transferase-like glycosyltransferase
MTPDTPLLFFWTAGLFCLARLISRGRPAWWLGVGTAAGLALDSKYTAVLFGLSVLVWLVTVAAARIWLRTWQTYAAGLLALMLFMPVLLWNAAHHWASFIKQGGRGGAWAPAETARYLAELLAGQIGLATPLVLAAFCVGLWRIARLWQAPGSGLILCVTAVPALVFLEHTLGGRVQANWPGVIYPGAALAAASAGVRFWRSAAVSGMAFAVPVYAQAAYAPLALPRRVDFTLIRLAGWDDLAGAVYAVAQAKGASFVAADEYGLASELAFRLHMPVIGVESRWRLFELPPVGRGGDQGILVRSARRTGPPDPAIWPNAKVLGDVARQRHGVVAETYHLYMVGPPARAAEAVTLPSRAPLKADRP